MLLNLSADEANVTWLNVFSIKIFMLTHGAAVAVAKVVQQVI